MLDRSIDKIGFRILRDHRSGRRAVRGPLRGELFNLDQLKLHAEGWARQYTSGTTGTARDRLLPQLARNEQVLLQARDLAQAAVAAGRRVAPATEWLLDNFYLIEQQILMARQHLPRAYSRQLPCLLETPLAGYPRVYGLALELIAHVDGRIDAENIASLLAGYQTVTPLKLGELWAFPIMLRLALIENLSRIAARIAHRREDRNRAMAWSDRMLKVAEQHPRELIQVLADLARSDPPLTSHPFVEEMVTRLQGSGPTVGFVLSWFEHQLADRNLTLEQLARSDSQVQVADQVSIANTITSLRLLGALDWKEFVEASSAVERLFRQNPRDIYARQDFATRDRYRHAVEEIATHSRLSEEAVAERAIELAARATPPARQSHVGYYLIDRGRAELEKAAGARWPVCYWLPRWGRRVPLFSYLACIGLLTLLVTGWVIAHLGPALLKPLVLPVLIAASAMAVAIVNRLATILIRPRALSRLDFSKGIPDDQRTLVVIPTLLPKREEIEDLVDALEVRYLGNRDPNLFFALVTDFADTPEETLPEDDELVALARQGIAALNEKYSGGFYHFHRPRVWNPHERLWMGYERKRGKLEQLNDLLRGGSAAPFSEITGAREVFPTIKYVITLDTDTQLPRGTAAKLIGTLAHPLNEPVYDPARRRVVEGYAILQPRASVSLPSATGSWFARLFTGEAGLDPYTHEVSDIYQDVFGEGSYIGKGIYHVDAFRQALTGRFPENLILSHDLLESCYARSALVSDVEVFEHHPASYIVESTRRHRWIRGDWQIIGWLNPWTHPAVSALGRWKIFDNLRRSLVSPALFFLLIVGWLATPAQADFWTAYVVAVLLFPPLLSGLIDLVRKPRQQTWWLHFNDALGNCLRQLARAALTLIMLPYDAVNRLDAIAQSGLRMLFTKRGLFLWHTVDYRRRNARRRLGGFYREMWVAPATAAVLAVRCYAEAPLLVLWCLAPAVGWWISQPIQSPPPVLTESERDLLRNLVRRTWRFFEEFIGESDNWLPPDNFQEVPTPTIASRTSPTNIGLALLAGLAAYDFGYLTAGQFLDRTERTFASLDKLERFRGHFLNWYDTRTLKSLPPLYVSSVDSGNLAGALVTLRAGLEELKSDPVLSPRWADGLQDTLLALRAVAPDLPDWRHKIRTTPASLREGRALLQDLIKGSGVWSPAGAEAQWWTRAFQQQCQELLGDLDWIALAELDRIPTLQDLVQSKLPAVRERATDRLRLIDRLVERCHELVADMDFSFLYDPARALLAIGYNITERRRDPSYYDLLASESRLGSFLLIAHGQLPQEHWFSLGRLLTYQDQATALISWSGSMFEYLMPLLLMPNYPHTLLAQTYQGVVARQIEYGRQRGVPWGVSESCYSVMDSHQTYQYQAFGVPGLGLKRGLSDDLVIAPYATALALMVAPHPALENLRTLTADGCLGAFGLIDAIDYTPSRVPRGQTGVPVRTFMAHHQGMSLLAFEHLLLGRPMQRRFMSDALMKATELLLHERVPKAIPALYPHPDEATVQARPLGEAAANTMRVFTNPTTPVPEAHLLSNGSYHVMVTQAGGGYSRWRGLAVTRWREDATADNWGSFIYLRDVESGRYWSASHQPTLQKTDRYEAIFLQARAEYRRRDLEIDAHTEICVSPEDDVEIRRVKLTNLSRRQRRLEVTSYAEVVLAPPTADYAHRVFGNLFVQTEILADRQAILGTRRPRAPEERPPFLLHQATVEGHEEGEPSFETDRARFIGRGQTAAAPAALAGPSRALSNSAGPVLDPIIATRRVVTLEPDEFATIYFITGVTETREQALALVEKYRDPRHADRAFEMAWSHSQVMLRQLQSTEADAQLYGSLAGSILYANPLHRAPASVITRNRLGQSRLWRYGVSGDWPIVLVRIADVNRADLVKETLQAHTYWRMKGLTVDLVILNEDFSGYRQALQDRIMGLIAASGAAALVDKPGGVFVCRNEQLAEEDRVLFKTVARIVLTDSAETLAEQVQRRLPPDRLPGRFAPTRKTAGSAPADTLPKRELVFFNGLGGFTPDGREYVITLTPGQTTPAPWANVIANAALGTVVSESGSAYTWAENAHEFRLTPWHNDPLSDSSGEAFYLRDEETGRYWSPTALPARGAGDYVTRHGFGYSVFEHDETGIHSELWTYVAIDAPVKFGVIKLRNHSGRARRLSVTGYWEWVLGEWRHSNLMQIITEIDPPTGAIFARNPYSSEFAERIAFASVSEPVRTATGSRIEFLGRNGTLATPAALGRVNLSGRVGAGLDPCAALQSTIELAAGQEREIVFLIGAGRSAEEAQQFIRRFGGSGGARQALDAVWGQWNRLLGTVYVETPDPSLNFLVNGWLEYQTISCRLWGRSGYYQSGGAFGFRDQLQDTMALVHSAPWLGREQLVRCAGRQFREGDVQHWWHPPSGRGVRTHFSDDYLWLPYATARYVKATGDTGVLDERLPFLEGRPVNPDEESYYSLPAASPENGTLYEHCVRAIEHGLRFGAHGLPLMGCGDWNDGMNLVGIHGKGESVWLAWFLCDVLGQFATLAERRGDNPMAERCRTQAAELAVNIEQQAWDGDWYRRAYFDDGTPLGSAGNAECQIDSISQSWAVISGAGNPQRARQAMAAVANRLVRPQAQLIQLLDPPFDKSALQPGYIKGYVPGVRENGGQYTHGAIWTVMAFALLGEPERAWELFQMLNPIHHAMQPAEVATYKVEPYVMPADIYSAAPHTGRGGWTWYTGSAGWMHRLAVETLLGIQLEVDKLQFTPRLPAAWNGYQLHYRYHETFHHIEVKRIRPAGDRVVKVIVDGVEQPDLKIPLLNDRREHRAEVQLG